MSPVLQLDSVSLDSGMISLAVNAKENTDTGNIFMWSFIRAGHLNRQD